MSSAVLMAALGLDGKGFKAGIDGAKSQVVAFDDKIKVVNRTMDKTFSAKFGTQVKAQSMEGQEGLRSMIGMLARGEMSLTGLMQAGAGAGRVLGGAFASLGVIGLVVGATVAAGKGIGALAGKIYDMTHKIDTGFSGATSTIKATEKSVKELNEAKLTALKDEIKGVADKFAELTEDAAMFRGFAERKSGTKAEAEKLRIEEMPISEIEKKKKLAQLEKDLAVEAIEFRKAELDKAAKLELDELKSLAEKKADIEKKRIDEARRGESLTIAMQNEAQFGGAGQAKAVADKTASVETEKRLEKEAAAIDEAIKAQDKKASKALTAARFEAGESERLKKNAEKKLSLENRKIYAEEIKEKQQLFEKEEAGRQKIIDRNVKAQPSEKVANQEKQDKAEEEKKAKLLEIDRKTREPISAMNSMSSVGMYVGDMKRNVGVQKATQQAVAASERAKLEAGTGDDPAQRQVKLSEDMSASLKTIAAAVTGE